MSATKNELNKIAKPTTERTLLSICLQHPDALIEIKEQEVVPKMFLIEANQYIYQCINYLYSKQQEPTPVAIMEVLKDQHAKSVVEDFGGVEYLSLLAEQRVNKKNIAIFCQKLKQAYTTFELFNICEDSKNFLLSDKIEVLNPTEIISSVEERLIDLSSAVQQTKQIYKIGDNIEETLALRAENPSSVPGLEVGWNKFDYYTGGGQPGELVMVCARAKTGKSTILTNWAAKFAIKDRIPILYFDTEMNSQQQEDRILSILSGVPHREIVSGTYVIDTENGKAQDKLAAIRGAVREMQEGSYFHIYEPSFTIEKVTATAKSFKLHNNIQAVFFDYLKMPSSQISMLKQAQEYQILGYLTSGLKDMGGTLGIPVYSACQENRSDPKNSKKDETNVGGSDRILQLADKLIFLTNKSDEDILKEGEINGNQRLYIAYQRNSESDCPPINIKFDKPKLTMQEA